MTGPVRAERVASRKAGRALTTFLVAITLLFTVTAALLLGILAGYGAIRAILYAFSRRPTDRGKPTPALAPSLHPGD
jgi:hypothetical protein